MLLAGCGSGAGRPALRRLATTGYDSTVTTADPDAPALPSLSRTLAGRTVLVTGGAHRVGGAISRHLAGLGARVVVHYHASRAAAEALVGELPHGGRAIAADLATADGAAALLAACDAAGERPDAVVHSAASFLRKRVEETTVEEWDAVFALNLRAFFLLAREMASRLPAGTAGEVAGEEAGSSNADREGAPAPDRALIAISDSGAYELWPGYAAHCTAKAALLPLVRVLAKALAPAIRVNAVVPGPVLPEPDTDARQVEAMARRTLVQRLGDPSDVAAAVAFLLANRFTTGSVVEVTGGAHLWRGSLGRDTGSGPSGRD